MRWGGFAGCVLAVLAAGCGKAGKEHGELTGKVTMNGRSPGVLTLVVTGPDGKTAGGNTNDAGEYRIPDPPQGDLKFQVIAPRQVGKPPAVPAKYGKQGNGITYSYTGGNQTYDIDLKP
ncbi:MAG: hypothetical protein JWO38_3140 [Gemmataceae bacterium]|nr:hypothetical protein [Gemmataceae bacterium]